LCGCFLFSNLFGSKDSHISMNGSYTNGAK
jgi:hypothetical protein